MNIKTRKLIHDQDILLYYRKNINKGIFNRIYDNRPPKAINYKLEPETGRYYSRNTVLSKNAQLKHGIYQI